MDNEETNLETNENMDDIFSNLEEIYTAEQSPISHRTISFGASPNVEINEIYNNEINDDFSLYALEEPNQFITPERPKKRNRNYSPPKISVKKFFLEDIDTNSYRCRKIDFEELEADWVIEMGSSNVKCLSDIEKLNETLNYRCNSHIKV